MLSSQVYINSWEIFEASQLFEKLCILEVSTASYAKMCIYRNVVYIFATIEARKYFTLYCNRCMTVTEDHE